MGIAFSSSLFGLAGSLVLGFLDLQAGQAQNRFYTDLEDWLSTTVRDLHGGEAGAPATPAWMMIDQFTAAIDRLELAIKESGSQQASESTFQLADSLKALVQHMRQEQQIVRSWVEEHGEQQSEIRKLLEKLSRAPATERRR